MRQTKPAYDLHPWNYNLHNYYNLITSNENFVNYILFALIQEQLNK